MNLLLEQEKVFHLEVLLPIPILNFALGGGWGSPIMMMTPTPITNLSGSLTEHKSPKQLISSIPHYRYLHHDFVSIRARQLLYPRPLRQK